MNPIQAMTRTSPYRRRYAAATCTALLWSIVTALVAAEVRPRSVVLIMIESSCGGWRPLPSHVVWYRVLTAAAVRPAGRHPGRTIAWRRQRLNWGRRAERAARFAVLDALAGAPRPHARWHAQHHEPCCTL